MVRWLAGGAVMTLVIAACHSSTTPAGGGDDDDTGDDDGSVCAPCDAPGNVSISCGGTACVDGTEYQCSSGGEGIIEVGTCGDLDSGAGDAMFVTLDGSQETAPCMPECTAGTCGGNDNCGGTCACATGVCDTMTGLCSNGCDNIASDPCVPGSTSSALCCVDDTQCRTNDAGVSTCCAASGIPGLCQSDPDCCAYPQAHCNVATMQCE